VIKFTLVADLAKPANKPFEPLTPGEYEGVIKEIRPTTIRAGRHAGKPSLDIAVQLDVDSRYIWKVLPMFTPAYAKKLSKGDTKWYQMSTVSFAEVTGAEDKADLSTLIGEPIKVLVGMHQDNGYGPQNSIVRFIK
jgi:hypothetical protein